MPCMTQALLMEQQRQLGLSKESINKELSE
jgi:hypothetical protein